MISFSCFAFFCTPCNLSDCNTFLSSFFFPPFLPYCYPIFISFIFLFLFLLFLFLFILFHFLFFLFFLFFIIPFFRFPFISFFQFFLTSFLAACCDSPRSLCLPSSLSSTSYFLFSGFLHLPSFNMSYLLPAPFPSCLPHLLFYYLILITFIIFHRYDMANPRSGFFHGLLTRPSRILSISGKYSFIHFLIHPFCYQLYKVLVFTV